MLLFLFILVCMLPSPPKVFGFKLNLVDLMKLSLRFLFFTTHIHTTAIFLLVSRLHGVTGPRTLNTTETFKRNNNFHHSFYTTAANICYQKKQRMTNHFYNIFVYSSKQYTTTGIPLLVVETHVVSSTTISSTHTFCFKTNENIFVCMSALCAI